MSNANEALMPDAQRLAMAEQFLTTLDSSESCFTFQTFSDKPDRDSHLTRLFHGSLTEHAPALLALNQQGAGVFVAINATDLTGRRKENIQRVRAVFADTDGAPLPPILDCETPPSIIVESSPQKWHAYWLTDSLEKADFKRIQHGIAARFQTDKSVNDLPRLMRLAGFFHHKGAPFLTRLIDCTSDKYSAEQLHRSFNVPAANDESHRKKIGSNAPDIKSEAIIKNWQYASPANVDDASLIAGLPAHSHHLLVNGAAHGQRSEAIYGVCKDLMAQGATDDAIARILATPNHLLSAKAYENGRHTTQEAQAWLKEYTIAKCRLESVHTTNPLKRASIALDNAALECVRRGYISLPDSFRRTVIGKLAASTAKALEFPEASAALALLACASTAVASAYAVRYRSGTVIPTGIYCVIEQPPAMQKSHLLSIVQRAYLSGTNAHNLKISARNKALEKDDVKAKPCFSVATDATSAALDMYLRQCSEGRFFIASAEQAAFQSLFPEKCSYASNDALLLQGWAGELVNSMRKGREAFSGIASAAVLLIAQQGSAARVFQASNGSGLAERFFYCSEPSLLGKRQHNGETIPPEHLSAFNKAIHACLEKYSAQRFAALDQPQDPERLTVLTPCPKGYALLQATRRGLEPKLGELNAQGLSVLVGWYGKAETHALKLAAVLHVIECLGHNCEPSSDIPLTTLEMALALVYALGEHLSDLMHDSEEVGTTAEANAVLRYLSKQPKPLVGITSALRNTAPFSALPKDQKTRRIKETVQNLLDGGLVQLMPCGDIKPS